MVANSSLKNAAGGGIVLLNIDEEFRTLLPCLTDDESAGLKARLLKDGWDENEVIRLATWPGLSEPVILDGYNRYRICSEQSPPIEFKTTLMEFNSREEAMVWMYEFQKSRRNLLPYARVALELVMEKIYAEVARQNKIRKPADSVPQNSGEQSGDDWKKVRPDYKARETTGMIAKAAGVSRDTVDRVKYIQNNANREDIRDVLLGEKSINATYIKVRSANDPEFAAKVMPEEQPSEEEIDSFAVFNNVYGYNARKAEAMAKIMIDVMGVDAESIITMIEPERTRALQSLITSADYLNGVIADIRKYMETSKDVMEIVK